MGRKFDRVKETTSVTGTGDATLLGAVAGYQAFDDVYAVGDLVPYCIAGQTPGEWEVGDGIYSATDTLTRAAEPVASSNGGAPVSFSAGTKNVFVTIHGRDANYTGRVLALVRGLTGP